MQHGCHLVRHLVRRAPADRLGAHLHRQGGAATGVADDGPPALSYSHSVTAVPFLVTLIQSMFGGQS